MKSEDKTLLKRKMEHQADYKKKAALLDDIGKQQLIDLILGGAVCELQQKQILEGEPEAQTLTIKFYFNPT